MDVIRTVEAYREIVDDAHSQVHPVGLVPTMGAFHDGHRSIMRRAVEERDTVIVSVFVNPLQFGEGEDYDRYPRGEEDDIAVAEAQGVEVMFLPTVEEMYPEYPPMITVDPGSLGDRFEGAARPGHFRGVLTVVARLLDLSGTCRVYFGEKDAQQLFLVRKMAAEIAPRVEVVGCPTIREADGLAMSSRNVYLEPEERAAAACLHRGLQDAQHLLKDGETDAAPLAAAIRAAVEAEPLADLDYAVLVDDMTFEELGSVDLRGSPARALVAARIGATRLIDNLLLANS
ncbi:MAG: pantoate--beta-alanine ligase [Actinomycetota bacterium]